VLPTDAVEVRLVGRSVGRLVGWNPAMKTWPGRLWWAKCDSPSCQIDCSAASTRKKVAIHRQQAPFEHIFIIIPLTPILHNKDTT
jgi:hypothetical protein